MVYGLTDWQFWIAFLWFWPAVLISWYAPGSLILGWLKLKQSPLRHWLLALVTGAVLWAAQGYVFGYLQLRFVSYVYVALAGYGLWKTWPAEQLRWKQLLVAAKKIPWWTYALVIVGGLNQYIHVAGSGLKYGDIVGFFQVNAVDGMMHLSFLTAMVREFPPQQPGAVGLYITNYHYWADLMTAELARVWLLPVSHLFFQFVPIILVLGTGVATYAALQLWTKDRVAMAIGLFLLYFGGDLGYLVSLVLHQTWGFQAAAIDNGATQLLNMPHGVAKLIFTTALIPLTHWTKTRSWRWGLLTITLLACVIGFKVYYGIYAAAGLLLIMSWLFFTDAWQLFRRQPWQKALPQFWQKQWPTIGLGLLYAVVTLAIFLPPNQHAGGLFWSPLEWPRLFLSPQHLDFRDWWLRKQVYEAAGNQRGILFMDALAIGICLLAIYGTRLAGFLPWPKTYKRLGLPLTLFFLLPSAAFIILGLNTLQHSGLFNVFNFFVVTIIPATLLSALMLTDWWRAHWLGKVAVLVIMVISVPRVVYHDVVILRQQAALKLEASYSANDLAALNFIRLQTPPEAIIQAHPNNYWDQKTPYVAFFTNRQTYLTGVGSLFFHNQPYQDRLAAVETLFNTTSEQEFGNQLRDWGIDYLYLHKVPEEELDFSLDQNYLTVVYENPETMVLKIN